jgi:hypothetical protein
MPLVRCTNGSTRVRAMNSESPNTISNPLLRIASMYRARDSGAMRAATSISALMRELPQTIAACAPNRYHPSSCSAMTTARALRSSATVRWFDTTKTLRDPQVDSEIVQTVLLRGPFRAQRFHVVSKFMAHSESLVRRHARSLIRPATSLSCCDRLPVTAREGDQIFVPHDFNDTRCLSRSRSFPAPLTRSTRRSSSPPARSIPSDARRPGLRRCRR